MYVSLHKYLTFCHTQTAIDSVFMSFIFINRTNGWSMRAKLLVGTKVDLVDQREVSREEAEVNIPLSLHSLFPLSPLSLLSQFLLLYLPNDDNVIFTTFKASTSINLKR
jgi:hypothetical protein